MSAATAPLLDVTADPVASAVAAQEGGAGRAGPCAALEPGEPMFSGSRVAIARDPLTGGRRMLPGEHVAKALRPALPVHDLAGPPGTP